MSGIEILVGILGTVITGVVVWGIERLAKLIGLKEDSMIVEQAEKWLEKGVNAYNDDLEKLIEEGVDDITKKSEVVHKIYLWMNDNAPVLVDAMGFESPFQVEQWVWAKVEEMLEEKKKNSNIS